MNKKKSISKGSGESNSDLTNQENTKNENFVITEELSLKDEPASIQDNMEVHHHPDLHHNPKPWKEYFLEFLMIFLAVSMGFLAENYREKLLNKEKELHFAENLVRDMKGEKRDIIDVIKKNEQQMVAIDSFVNIRALDFTSKLNTALFYRLLEKTSMWGVSIVSPNEITLIQIKATGGLNIIRPKIAELIAELDMSIQKIKMSNQYPTKHAEETFRLIYELTDYPSIWDPNRPMPPLMTDDKKKLMKFFNLSADLMYTIDGYNNDIKNHLAIINRVITTLEDEYDLRK